MVVWERLPGVGWSRAIRPVQPGRRRAPTSCARREPALRGGRSLVPSRYRRCRRPSWRGPPGRRRAARRAPVPPVKTASHRPEADVSDAVVLELRHQSSQHRLGSDGRPSGPTGKRERRPLTRQSRRLRAALPGLAAGSLLHHVARASSGASNEYRTRPTVPEQCVGGEPSRLRPTNRWPAFGGGEQSAVVPSASRTLTTPIARRRK